MPAVWESASPEAVLAARLRAVDATLRRLLGEEADRLRRRWREAAELALRAAEACTRTARPLYAAHADLPVPDEPHLALWHAATLLREHRGDGHLAALLAPELDPLEALVSHTATGKGMAPQVGPRHPRLDSARTGTRRRSGCASAACWTPTGELTEAGVGPAQGARGRDGPAGPRARTSTWARTAWPG